MEREELLYQLKRFLDDEAKACSMDYGCITSEYVSRMWGDVFTWKISRLL